MASQEAQKLHELGVWLNDAWQEFAPQSLTAALAALPSSSDEFNDKFKPKNSATFFNAIGSVSKVSIERNRIQLEMRESLLTDLFNEQLIATGRRERPSRSNGPVIISADKFEFDEPNWSDDAFTVHGIRYGAIKVTDPRDPRLALRIKPPKGSIAAIEKAIGALCKSHPDFCDWHRQKACDEVRKTLKSDYKRGNGLSDQNISKAIVAHCKPKGISI